MCGAQTMRVSDTSLKRTSSAASSSEVAIGFSMRTCLPAAYAFRPNSPRSFMLVRTKSAYTSATEITSSEVTASLAPGQRCSATAARAGSGSKDRRHDRATLPNDGAQHFCVVLEYATAADDAEVDGLGRRRGWLSLLGP